MVASVADGVDELDWWDLKAPGAGVGLEPPEVGRQDRPVVEEDGGAGEADHAADGLVQHGPQDGVQGVACVQLAGRLLDQPRLDGVDRQHLVVPECHRAR